MFGKRFSRLFFFTSFQKIQIFFKSYHQTTFLNFRSQKIQILFHLHIASIILIIEPKTLAHKKKSLYQTYMVPNLERVLKLAVKELKIPSPKGKER
jgi:hypothetical protein